MKFCLVWTALVLALAPSAFSMSQKPKVTVRFHAEANPNDGSSFVMPVKLQYLRRDAHLSRVPAFSEKQIKAIFPFPADDGSWGCHFQLDTQGRIRLETMSSEQLNTALVLYVGTKTGQHQVIDMLIDRPVASGSITVPRGLTPAEVVVLKTQFTVIGEEKVKKKPDKKKKDDVIDWRLDRSRDDAPKPPAADAPAAVPAPVAPRGSRPATAPVPRQKLREIDLPRVGD